VNSSQKKLTVFDIGARAGMHPRWNNLPIQAIGFEADTVECARLNAAGGPVRFLPYALGSADNQPATLNITSGIGCSSLYEPNQTLLAPYWHRRYWQIERKVPVTLTKLDTVCERDNILPDVMKIDIQGGELDALKGGVKSLGNVMALELEVAFSETYTGQALFAEIDIFLREHGFSLVKLRTESWRRGEEVPKSPYGATVLYGDALYLHEPRLAASPEKAALIYKAYKLHDRSGEVHKPNWWQRLVGLAMRKTDGGYKTWRTWLDSCAYPSIRDFRDPDL
jgi:FkbM family methyltransferase